MKILIETWMNDNLREVIVEVNIPYILSSGEISFTLESLLEFKYLKGNERFDSLSIDEDKKEGGSIEISTRYIMIKIPTYEDFKEYTSSKEFFIPVEKFNLDEIIEKIIKDYNLIKEFLEEFKKYTISLQNNYRFTKEISVEDIEI